MEKNYLHLPHNKLEGFLAYSTIYEPHCERQSKKINKHQLIIKTSGCLAINPWKS